jgi:hypothetical protein
VPTIDTATALLAAAIQPALQILALANIKHFQLVATLYHSLDANTRDSNTTSDRQLT